MRTFDIDLTYDFMRLVHVVQPPIPTKNEPSIVQTSCCNFLFTTHLLPFKKGRGSKVASQMATEDAKPVASRVHLAVNICDKLLPFAHCSIFASMEPAAFDDLGLLHHRLPLLDTVFENFSCQQHKHSFALRCNLGIQLCHFVPQEVNPLAEEQVSRGFPGKEGMCIPFDFSEPHDILGPSFEGALDAIFLALVKHVFEEVLDSPTVVCKALHAPQISLLFEVGIKLCQAASLCTRGKIATTVSAHMFLHHDSCKGLNVCGRGFASRALTGLSLIVLGHSAREVCTHQGRDVELNLRHRLNEADGSIECGVLEGAPAANDSRAHCENARWWRHRFVLALHPEAPGLLGGTDVLMRLGEKVRNVGRYHEAHVADVLGARPVVQAGVVIKRDFASFELGHGVFSARKQLSDGVNALAAEKDCAARNVAVQELQHQQGRPILERIWARPEKAAQDLKDVLGANVPRSLVLL